MALGSVSSLSEDREAPTEDNLVLAIEGDRMVDYDQVLKLYREVLNFAEEKGYEAPDNGYHMPPSQCGCFDHPENGKIYFYQRGRRAHLQHEVKVWATNDETREKLSELLPDLETS